MEQFRCGTQDGTGAAINIELGWQPDLIVVQNNEAADFTRMEWQKGMTAAHGLKTVTSTNTLVTSNGLSLYSGSKTAKEGFTIGADTDLNVNGERITWMAWRNIP